MSADSRFAVVLPPGFARIPLDASAEEVFEPFVERAALATPASAAATRAYMRQTIRRALASAREQRATDLILATEPVAGVPVPASVVVSRVSSPSGDTRTPEETLIAWAARGESTPIEIDGLAGLRRVRFATGDDDTPAHKAITYIVYLPWESQWLAFTASIVWSDDPEVLENLEAIEFLLDVIIETVRIERAEVAS